MALSALEKIKVTGQLTAALGELNTAANAIAKVKAAKAVTELLARLGVGQAQAEPEKIRNFGWDSVKLADLTYEQLDTLRKQVEAEHVNPKDSEGRYVENGKQTIYVYDAKGRKKLDALSWAVTHKLKDDKKSSAEPQVKPENSDIQKLGIS